MVDFWGGKKPPFFPYSTVYLSMKDRKDGCMDVLNCPFQCSAYSKGNLHWLALMVKKKKEKMF